jgi:sigma-E factor negative regulatory protein RseA
MSEKLSALMDNELSELEERRLLKELEGNAELRATWERYHVIRAAMRKDTGNAAPAGLVDAVARAIDGEPARRPRFAVTLGKAVGGLAVAATVTAIAILNFPSPLAPNDEALAKVPVPAATTVAERSNVPGSSASPLSTYLAEHAKVAPSADMGNMSPYVRTVNDNQK